jgi:hypothetical protein
MPPLHFLLSGAKNGEESGKPPLAAAGPSSLFSLALLLLLLRLATTQDKEEKEEKEVKQRQTSYPAAAG